MHKTAAAVRTAGVIFLGLNNLLMLAHASKVTKQGNERENGERRWDGHALDTLGLSYAQTLNN